MLRHCSARLVGAVLLVASAAAENPPPAPLTTAFLSASGVFPALTVTADSAPQNVSSPRSECGVGAMMAWADRLYVVSYLSVPNAGNGTGLYAIDQNLQMEQLAAHSSVYANRFLHPPSNSIIIGPYVIDAARNVRTFTSLLTVRVGGMAEPGHDGVHARHGRPAVGVRHQHAAVHAALRPRRRPRHPRVGGGAAPLQGPQRARPALHPFPPPPTDGPCDRLPAQAAHTMNGTLYVCSNTFEEADGLGLQHGGRLATCAWGTCARSAPSLYRRRPRAAAGDGNMAHNWTILERTAFVEVTGR